MWSRRDTNNPSTGGQRIKKHYSDFIFQGACATPRPK